VKLLVGKCQDSHGPSLRAGDIVQVLSENEILATLDKSGTLQGLSFSEGMRKYCGKRCRVLKQVSKIVVEGVGIGRINHTVILEKATCDGEAFDGCRKTCLLLWKEDWLKKIENKPEEKQSKGMIFGTGSSNCVNAGFSACQSINLFKAISPLPAGRGRVLLYLADIKSGSYSLLEVLRVIFNHTVKGFLLRENTVYTVKPGTTPTSTLSLQPGELVEVKGREEIQATLDLNGKNRGLLFTPEMIKYCGRRYRVLQRLDKMYVEEKGIMRRIANTVLLDGVTCDGTAHCGCLRTCYCMFREIWLKRVK